jgi:hypothetical protein
VFAENPRIERVLTWSAYQTRLPDELVLGPRWFVSPPVPGVRKLGPDTGEQGSPDASPLAELRRAGAEYVVIRTGPGTHRHPAEERLLDELRRDGELVAEFSPLADPAADASVGTRVIGPSRPLALEVFGQRCFGSSLEVYRVPPPR